MEENAAKGYRHSMPTKDAEKLSYCTYNILFVNDMVMSCLHDIVFYIKDSPFYRHKAKCYLDRLVAHKTEYERMLRSIYANAFEKPLADMIENYNEHFDDDITLLRKSITEHLKGLGDKQAEIRAYVYLGKVISELAVAIFRDRTNIIKSIPNRPFGATLNFLSVEKVAKDCDNLAYELGYYRSDDTCAEAQEILDRISNNLSDAQLISDALV